MPSFTTIAHVDLTVSDADASTEWYCEVLGLRNLHRGVTDGRITVVLLHQDTGLIVGLNQHDVTKVDTFDERNVGLDHIGFGVTSRDDLDQWELRLTELGVEHSPVADTPVGSALVFRDPDNIQLEFWWTPPREPKN
ncbi:MAG TPA: VOC family protein [Microthrixaceae bacterium]|nr:VOC family protein [Microthrixaceae bacterium]